MDVGIKIRNNHLTPFFWRSEFLSLFKDVSPVDGFGLNTSKQGFVVGEGVSGIRFWYPGIFINIIFSEKAFPRHMDIPSIVS
jgi:hypothetical protein